MRENSRRTAVLIISLMALSGAAALIYEIVWLRMLTRAFGVTIHSAAGAAIIYSRGRSPSPAVGKRGEIRILPES